MTHDQWNVALDTFSDAGFQQGWSYAEVLASRRSCTHEEVGFWEGETLVGLASVRIRQLPVLGLGVAYVAGGPLSNRGSDGDVLRFQRCLRSLRDEYVKKRNLALRILPPIGDLRWNQLADEAMLASGMTRTKSGRTYRTIILDLRRPLDEIRKGFAQKWRNCLNASERGGFTVRWTNEKKAFAEFRNRHDVFVRSKGFSVDLDAGFYATIRDMGESEDGLELAIVERDGLPIASHLGSYLGDTAVYLLGLTEDAALDSKAAYFLHWEVIKKAHARGMAWYDLGGIDPEENPGVYRFKAGFQGEDVRAAGPMEFLPGIIRRTLLKGLEKAMSLKKR